MMFQSNSDEMTATKKAITVAKTLKWEERVKVANEHEINISRQ